MQDDTGSTIIDLVQAGNTPMAVAEQLNVPLHDVHSTLIAANVDWAPKKEPGRPITPLKPGQQFYAERAYQAHYSQAHISERVRASLNRVRRHLLTSKLFATNEKSAKDIARQKRLMQAINLYIHSVPVMTIVHVTNIQPPVLYAALKARSIPLRTKTDIEEEETTSHAQIENA
jgi:hypothetical protein